VGRRGIRSTLFDSTPSASNRSRILVLTEGQAKGLHLSNIREFGTCFRIEHQIDNTFSFTLAKLLKEPKVINPWTRAGRGLTSGASEGGV